MAKLAQAIKDAQEAAAQTAAEDPSTAVVEAQVSPAGVVTPFVKPSMASVAAATGVIPRSTPYIKVNEFGMLVGAKSKTFIEEMEVKILMVEEEGFQVKHTVRYGVPAQYMSTFDGDICDKGGAWTDAVLKARQADPKAEVYPAADIIVTLTKDVPRTGKEEDLKAGTRLAINTSKSNFSEWSDFYAEVAKKELLGQEIDVKLGFREINHNGNTWGVITFELM